MAYLYNKITMREADWRDSLDIYKEQIARVPLLTRERIRQIEIKALKKLRIARNRYPSLA